MANEENKGMNNVEQATENTVSMEELQKKLQEAEAENKKLKKNLNEAKKEAKEAEEAAEAAKIDAELAQQEKETAQKEAEELKRARAENQKMDGATAKKELTPGQKHVQMERRMHQAMEEAKKDTVKIKLPYIPGAKDNEVFVGVNGYRYQIQRGVEVEVPRFVAEALENSEKQKMHADATLQALQAKAEAGEKAQVL